MSTSASIDIAEVVKYGWRTTLDNFGYFVVLLILIVVANILLNLLHPFPIVGTLAAIAGQVIVNMGVIAISLGVLRGVKPEYATLFKTYQHFWPFFLATLLNVLIVGIGFVLLIVPGIIALVSLQFFTFLIIDKGLSATESLKESYRITEGNRWQLFGLLIVLALINVLGAIPFGIGLLWTIPTTMMAMAFAYGVLAKNTQEDVVLTAPEYGPDAAPPPSHEALEGHRA